MGRYIMVGEGIAGWLECLAADKRAARAYFAEFLGLRTLPRRHCIARIA